MTVQPPSGDPIAALRLLFVVTEDWYFWSHRLELARHARDAGYAVMVATHGTGYRARIEAEGFAWIEIPFERSLRHPLGDLANAWRIFRLIRQRRPALVHLVALKPILLSGLAVWLCPGVRYVHAVTGMGYLFSSGERSARLVRMLVVAVLRFVSNRRCSAVIVQNADDRALLARLGIDAARMTLIRGSGVDTQCYAPASPAASTAIATGTSRLQASAAAVVLLPARLIRDKGIAEFVAAARIVKQTQPGTRFVLCGARDPDNPAGIAESEIAAWIADAAVEWWGHRNDMTVVYPQAAIVCLPSYREGLPKALLEAAACGRPLVATDVPGCREICRHEETGLLVPARDAHALADAIARLLGDPGLRERLGSAGRALVEREYSTETVARETLAVYAALVARSVA